MSPKLRRKVHVGQDIIFSWRQEVGRQATNAAPHAVRCKCEMRPAALPSNPGQDLAQRPFRAFVGVAGDQLRSFEPNGGPDSAGNQARKPLRI